MDEFLTLLKKLHEEIGHPVFVELSSNGEATLMLSARYITIDTFTDYRDMVYALEDDTKRAQYVARMREFIEASK